MASSAGEPTRKLGAEKVAAAWKTSPSAAGGGMATAMPMHIEAQQVLPVALSRLESLSGACVQCIDASACWWWDAPEGAAHSMALAVTGATSTASANSACRSRARLFMWRVQVIGSACSLNPSLPVPFRSKPHRTCRT